MGKIQWKESEEGMSTAVVKRSVFDAILFAYLASVVAVVATRFTADAMLNLGRNSLFFLVAMGVGVGLSWLLNRAHIKTLGEEIFEAPFEKLKGGERPWYRTLSGWELFLFLFVTLVVGAEVTAVSARDFLDRDGFQGAMRIFSDLLHPDMSLLPRAVAKVIETIFMAFMATAFSIPVAFVLCFLAAKNIMRHPLAFAVYLLIRLILNVARSIEAIVWAIVFSVWVGIGPFAGMLALMIHSIVSLAKQYSEYVETVEDGPIEGIQSTGASLIQVIWFAIVPQVVLPFISYTIYRWDTNIRMATIVGFVGGGGIGTLLFLYQQQGRWHEVGTIALVIAFVVWFMDTASAYLREALK